MGPTSFQVSDKVRLHPAWDGVVCHTKPRLRCGVLYCVSEAWYHPTNGLCYIRLVGVEVRTRREEEPPGLCALAFVPADGRGKEAA